MIDTQCPVQATFTLLGRGLPLEIAWVVTSAGPLTWPGVRRRLNGPRLRSGRIICHGLLRLHRLGLADRRSGPDGLMLYTARPALRRLLKVMDVSASSFSSPLEPHPAPPTDFAGLADGPEQLGL